MANEITKNYVSGLSLYFCCFQQNGDVFLTGGASDEVWGTGGRNADNYDEAMTEEASSGHYKGSMAAGIGAGVYQICVYVGASPADGDTQIGEGEIYWDGSAEINASTIDALIDTIITDLATAQADLDTITGSDGTTLSTASITALWAKAMSDLSAGAPSATASALTALNYLYEYWRNKVVTDSASKEIIVYKDDGTTKLCESDIDDDGALFTKGEFGAAD